MDPTDKNVRVINALDFPKPKWNADRKLFQVMGSKGSLHGDATAKGTVVKERYYTILQRLKRTTEFSDVRSGVQLTTIDALIGSPGQKCVFGLLTQLHEGQLSLEDPKGNVPLDLSNCKFSAGIFVEGALVVAYGEYNDSESVFKVDVLGFPPSESRVNAKLVLGNIDLFAPLSTDAGGKPTGLLSTKYPTIRATLEDTMDLDVPPEAEFVILSDVQVDKPQVVAKVRKIFEEFQEDPPAVIVMMGNFCSSPGSRSENVALLKQGMEKLADLITSFPRIRDHSRFVFIPGPTDPGGCVVSIQTVVAMSHLAYVFDILPNQPLPDVFVKALKEKIPHVFIASNPARIRFYGKDIVLFREDLVNKMKRHAIRNPEDDNEISQITQHLVKTICDQSHLCPLSDRPVYWNYDHTLFLYPLPDTIILADRFDQFEHDYDGCLCFNPGSFTTDFSFVIYKPFDKETQFSRIDE